ncbi:PAS domain S-box protein [Methanosarcina sp. MSH10X1]|uniref:PAS domain-containing protein n=1 Tax=Methanosarcina sp. MSH10X1 TaxID=2507075 RepID=UPI000FFB7906|nr:PAS domain-containing protein [Methanosarcina sp. MSH10X1]RXA21394.1 PAS domain S-box protein [Methanosarcina sp. MSH10X1]
MKNREHKPAKSEDEDTEKLSTAGRVFRNQTPANNRKETVIQSDFHFHSDFHFLKSMLDTILNPIYYKNRNGVYLGVNKAFARQIIGLPEEEIIGFTLPEVCRKLVEKFPERDTVSGRKLAEVCNEYNQIDTKLLKSGGSEIYEQEIILADGTRRTFFINKFAFRDEKGNISGLATIFQDITKLRESEKILEEIEERYGIVTEQTGQLVYDNDIRNNRLSWAGAVEEVFGYSLEEVKNFTLENWLEHIYPEDRNYVVENFMQARKTGGRERIEYRLRKKDGTYIYVEDTGTYLVNKDGNTYRVLGVVKDITEEKLARKQIEKGEERYRIVAEQTGQIVYDYDVEQDYAEWAGNTEELTGFTSKNFRDMGIQFWLGQIHPEDRNNIEKNYRRCITDGGTYRLEYRCRRKDGNYIFIEDIGACLKDKEGKVDRILGIIKNITERKLTQEKLEKSEEKYRSFIHNFKGVAFQLDENLIPEFTHGTVEEITGYTEEDFMSKQVMWMDIIYPEDRPAILKQVMRIKNSARTHDTEFEYRIIRKDGKIKWIKELYQKIQGRGEKSDKYQGAVYDITEKKEAEEALNEIKEARIKEIHHRIKNNLQVISSLLDLQAEKFEDEKVREAFRESQNRIVSMALIHEELYQERNTETLNFAAYLRKLVENLFQTYSVGHPGVNLQTYFKEEVFLNVEIAIPLGIVVNELVSNSLKHAFPGRRRGEIEIRLSKEEKSESKSWTDEDKESEGKKLEDKKYEDKEYKQGCGITELVLTVSDTGAGFPENVDIENPDTLGLQLVNALVDQLDGELELKTDGGTEFAVRLNIAENSETA